MLHDIILASVSFAAGAGAMLLLATVLPDSDKNTAAVGTDPWDIFDG